MCPCSNSSCTGDEENGSVHLDCKAVANLITEQFVKISIPQLEEESTDATSTAGNDGDLISVPLLSTNATPGDSVYTYATDFITTALFWYGFHDTIKMGDGNCITIYWKLLMPFSIIQAIITMLMKVF